jgi:hypothetical protein
MSLSWSASLEDNVLLSSLMHLHDRSYRPVRNMRSRVIFFWQVLHGSLLCRSSHHFPTARQHTGSPQAFPRSRVLDILSGKRRLRSPGFRITKTGEKCGIKGLFYGSEFPEAAECSFRIHQVNFFPQDSR